MPVDYINSKVFCISESTYGVYVNKGVNVKEVYKALTKYRGILVWLNSEVYSGPFTERGPDIVVIGDNDAGYTLGQSRIIGSVYVKTDKASHHLRGTLAINVDNQYFDLHKLPTSIYNRIVTPLIMCMMGVPVSDKIDDPDIIKLICRDVKFANYVAKWQLKKRIMARMHRR